jgi:CubicO group peptidase (beta-lactamase class C family)
LSTDDFGPAFARVDELFAQFHARQIAPGVAYGVIADGALAHAAGFGRTQIGGDVTPDADSVFRIASMTKSFTAIAVLLLRDRGLLRLDDPVRAYVPELADLPLPTGDSPVLTVRHLLTMSGGLPTDDPWGDRQESLAADDFSALLRRGFRFVDAPGVGFEYSNLGYAILGRIVGNVAEDKPADEAWPGQTAYHRFVRVEILEPLGMMSTGYNVDDAPRRTQGYRKRDEEWVPVPFARPGAFSSMGGLFSSVRDLSTWVLGMLDAFPPRDDPENEHPLGRSSRREMQQQQRAIGPTLGIGFDGPSADVRVGGEGYGYGLFVDRLAGRGTIVSHSGGYPGYGSNMRWHPASGLGVIALGNATYSPVSRVAQRALEDMLRILEVPARRPVTPWSDVKPSAATVERLVLTPFDDAVADTLFAENIDLDLARDERQDALAAAVTATGVANPQGELDLTSDGPAHAKWSRPGTHGRIDFAIRLSPELEPRVQTMTVTAIPTPPAEIGAVVAQVMAQLSADNIATAGSELAAAIGIARAFGGPFVLADEATSLDKDGRWTWTITTPGLKWTLGVGADRAPTLTPAIDR